MSMLLTKRLARSLWRTKLRLSAVVLMVAIGVFAGIAFGAYAITTTTLYDDIYRDLKNPRYSDPFIGMQLGAVRLPPARNFSDQTNSVPQQIHSMRSSPSNSLFL